MGPHIGWYFVCLKFGNISQWILVKKKSKTEQQNQGVNWEITKQLYSVKVEISY